jgi:hypothetical protein
VWCVGIAAANYSHVGYFPSRNAYDDFYEILTGVVDIGITSFKHYVIKVFVDYLRTHVDDASADWFEQNWKFLHFLQSHDIFTVVVLAGEGKGASTSEGVADAFRIAVEVCIAGNGAVIVPEFPEGDQNFIHFSHELLRFAT